MRRRRSLPSLMDQPASSAYEEKGGDVIALRTTRVQRGRSIQDLIHKGWLLLNFLHAGAKSATKVLHVI